jgi:hypothetical protein
MSCCSTDARAGGAARLFQPGRDRRTRSGGRAPACGACASRRGGCMPRASSPRGGHALEPKLRLLKPPAADDPRSSVRLFQACEEITTSRRCFPILVGLAVAAPPLIERAAYEEAVARVKQHIRAGDIYQANLTFAAEVLTAGSPWLSTLRSAEGARGPLRAPVHGRALAAFLLARALLHAGGGAGHHAPDEGDRRARRHARTG